VSAVQSKILSLVILFVYCDLLYR